jgi:K+-transporting ATPase ATPase B chain
MAARLHSIFDPVILVPAAGGAMAKLNPISLLRNPVMFVTEVGAVLTTIALLLPHQESDSFLIQIALWLWFTVLFGNFAEAMAEGRGKAQASALRNTRSETFANRVLESGTTERVAATALRKGDRVRVSAGEIVPSDGEIEEGVATVDESAITGESAPVIREAGGDRSAVTGGTRVLSDTILVRVTSNPGETFVDRMISLVEGAKRQKTPNEIALTIFLSALTLVFLVAIMSLKALGHYNGVDFSIPVLIALLVCLIPTTIGGLLSAIGIAGIDRLVQHNVLAMSGRAVEAAGDVDVLLLDKTGTITLGNRHAVEFIPATGVTAHELADAAQLASLADETPEGRSIVVLAKRFGIRARELHELPHAHFVPFTAQTRMSGVDIDGRQVRKGASDAIRQWMGGSFSKEVQAQVDRISRAGGTPLVVATQAADRLRENAQGGGAAGAPVAAQVLGTIYLKDVVKGGLAERFALFRAMGIRTIMITGDNHQTAVAIAAEAGVDDFMAEATPEDKLRRIRQEQAEGHLVAMTGDGTNDAPALAQADVGVAMNTGTQAAKEAGNMVDLDSNPTKLIEVVEIGKQLLITRGALTTFSMANDVAKYFAIIPAMLVPTFPEIAPLNIMGLHSADSAILSAVIFNALIIIALIPLALRGVAFRPLGASAILRRNLLIYGLGGVLVPFAGIKLIDLLISNLGLA